MAANPFEQFVQPAANPFAQFVEQKPSEVPMGRRVIEFVRPTVQALGGAGGALLGGAAGTFGGGPVGLTIGGVTGAGLGYGLAKSGLDVLEQQLGYIRPPASVKEAVTGGIKDVATGAAEQGLGMALGPIVAKGLEKGIAKVQRGLDFSGRTASKVTRAAAGDQIDAIRAALNNAPANELPSQATANIPRKAWQSLNELGTRLDATDAVLKTQTDDLLGDLSRLARGGNQTEIRNALNETRFVLNQLTSPMRETALSAANQANQTIARLGPQAAQKQQSMVSALQETGRMQTDAAQRMAASRAQLARIQDPSQIPAVSARGEARIQAATGRQFEEAADIFSRVTAQRRAERDFIQRQIGSLEDYGLRPLEVGNVKSAIDAAMAAPGRRVSAQQQQVLGKVQQQLDAAAAMNNGVIDARDLYTIRKEGVNEIVDDLLKGQDPKTSRKVAAEVLSIIRPEIDKAITKAGGSGWSDYLKTFEQGAKEIEKRQMAAEAVQMFGDSPNEYVRLVRGNNPNAVESVFGAGNFDIFKQMSKEMPTLQKAAEYLERQATIAGKAQAGREELAEILRESTWKRRLPNWFSPKVTAANLALADLENRVSKNTLQKIREATLSNKSMLELMDGLPSYERKKLTRLINTPAFAAQTPAGRAAAAEVLAPVTRTNGLSSDQSENALAQ